jgi:glutamine amidotransferase
VDVVVCDVGLGNLRSVERALAFAAQRLGGEGHTGVRISADPEVLRRADKIVMPGQGAFRDCAAALGSGLGEVVKERIAAGVPYLGICLGLQVLFASSDEAPGAAGLGVFPGTVARLPAGTDPTTGAALKIPHIGWNTARLGAAASASPTARLDEEDYFYFVHSYVVVPADPSLVAATTDYGGEFVSAIAKDNVFACQFHPEKSQEVGIAFLARFLAA